MPDTPKYSLNVTVHLDRYDDGTIKNPTINIPNEIGQGTVGKQNSSTKFKYLFLFVHDATTADLLLENDGRFHKDFNHPIEQTGKGQIPKIVICPLFKAILSISIFDQMLTNGDSGSFWPSTNGDLRSFCH